MALNVYRLGTAFPGVMGWAFKQSSPAWPRPLRALLATLLAGSAGSRCHQSRRSPWRVRRWSDDRGSVLRPASRAADRHRTVADQSVDANGGRRILLADQLVERRFGSQGAGSAMGIIVGSVVSALVAVVTLFVPVDSPHLGDARAADWGYR